VISWEPLETVASGSSARRKAHGAQEPQCTGLYMRIPSTAQRRNRIAQQVSRGSLLTRILLISAYDAGSHRAWRTGLFKTLNVRLVLPLTGYRSGNRQVDHVLIRRRLSP